MAAVNGSRGEPLSRATATTDHMQQVSARVGTRRAQFRFIAAPLDASAPGGDRNDLIVTGSASNLKNLPYAITASGDTARILHATPKGSSFSRLGASPFNTVEVTVPVDVEEIEIYLGNDAFRNRRHTPLFRTALNSVGTTLIIIHELPQKRLDRLQLAAATSANYPINSQGGTTKLADESHIGYLTGDVWKSFSYAFTLDDVRRLCEATTIQRPYAEDRGRSRIEPPQAPAAFPATTTGAPRPTPWGQTSPYPVDQRPTRIGDTESLIVTDWTRVLAPIYNGDVRGLSGSRNSEYACYIDLPVVNIRLRYAAGAFANATGAGKSVTVGDVLRRTNPVTYKGVIEAAWKSGVDELTLSSTWRPMLGSILHRMGIALDVVFVDDFDDRTAQGQEIRKFHVHENNRSRSALYLAFEGFVFGDSKNLSGFKADPWIRASTDTTHRHHLHVSALDLDEK